MSGLEILNIGNILRNSGVTSSCMVEVERDTLLNVFERSTSVSQGYFAGSNAQGGEVNCKPAGYTA